MEYFTYGYPIDVPLISFWNRPSSCDCSSTADVEAAVQNVITNLMPLINDNFDVVNEHINVAKEEILEGCDGGSDCGGCNGNGCGEFSCCTATKCDVMRAIEKINEHIDEKFDEVDILGHFADLRSLIE